MEAKATPPLADVRLPDGVVDHPPARAGALARRLRTIDDVLDRAGYARVFTPTFELLDVLEPGLGEIAKRAVFRVVDPASGEVVVLRPDFTAQVARMVSARLAERCRPLRLSYSGRVARARDPRGRDLFARDLFQTGVELIGADAAWADVEILTLALEVFEQLECEVTIAIGHAAFVDGLLDPKHDVRRVRDALAEKDRAAVERLAPEVRPLLDLYGDRSILHEARRVLNGPDVLAALDRLDALADAVERVAPNARLTFDLGEQRSLGYYTGPFFHGYVQGAPDAVLAGGRYDRLLGRFGAEEPATGFAIDVGALPDGAEDEAPRGVVVADDDPLDPTVVKLLETLRDTEGRAVVVATDGAYRYAEDHGFRAVVTRDGRQRSLASDTEVS
ncbi:MAG: ATP phosphoribosyltransferase regulatory subunit [Deltaproteobacteria bacterium]|jgi:ATP phosphoribosyltransferase regulatory subunit